MNAYSHVTTITVEHSITPRNFLMSLCSHFLPPTCCLNVFAIPAVSRHNFETCCIYNFFPPPLLYFSTSIYLVSGFMLHTQVCLFYCLSTPSSYKVTFSHPSVRQSIAKHEGRDLFQWMPFSSPLSIWRICLVLQMNE